MSKWATPIRQAYLVKLFQRSKGFCVFGERPCSNPTHHHYMPFIEGLIDHWQAEDRADSLALWQAEQRALHNLAERGAIRGQFNAIGRDIYHDAQPVFYLDGLGMSALTFRPFAKVRLASSYVCLHVDVASALRKVSKSQRRKAIRYGKPLSHTSKAEIDQICSMAVKDYLK